MNINTRNMAFVNFNGEEMQWVKFNGVIVYEAWKKLIASGTSLILFNCKGDKLIDYKFYGNSIQSPEPTPDAPVEVESVGEKTKNLFNKKTATIGVGLSTSNGGTYNTDKYFTTDYIVIEIGKKYAYNWNSTKWYCFYDENKNYLGYGSAPYSITNSSATFIRFTASVEELDTFQVYEGDYTTKYEPFGYKIPVIATNDLFKGVKLEQGTVLDANGNLTGSATRVRTNLFSLDAGTYTFLMDWSINKCMVKGVHVYNYEDEKWEQYTAYSSQRATFTLSKKSKIRITFNKSAQAEITPEDILSSNPVLQLGEEIGEVIETTTSIYLDEPLRKIRDFADYIDFENSKLVRYIKHYNFSGEENWKLYVDGKNEQFNTVIYNIGGIVSNGETKNCYSNRFNSVGRNYIFGYSQTGMSAASSHIRVYYPPLTETVEDFKTFLKNNPTYIDYILATPTEETIELPNVPTLKGTIALYVDTTIQPSNMEVVYKGKR